MYVNPFVFGMVVVCAAMFILTVIHTLIDALSSSNKDEEGFSPEDTLAVLQSMTGKKFRYMEQNGVRVFEAIEEGDGNEKSDKT